MQKSRSKYAINENVAVKCRRILIWTSAIHNCNALIILWLTKNFFKNMNAIEKKTASNKSRTRNKQGICICYTHTIRSNSTYRYPLVCSSGSFQLILNCQLWLQPVSIFKIICKCFMSYNKKYLKNL